MDISAERIRRDHTEQPQYDQNHKDGPQHAFSPCFRQIAWDVLADLASGTGKEIRSRLDYKGLGTAGTAGSFLSYGIPRASIFKQSVGEIVHLAFRIVFGNSITFLNFSHQLPTLSFDHFQIAVRQLSPFLSDFSGILLPFTFYLVPIHGLAPKLNFSVAFRTFCMGTATRSPFRTIEEHLAP